MRTFLYAGFVSLLAAASAKASTGGITLSNPTHNVVAVYPLPVGVSGGTTGCYCGLGAIHFSADGATAFMVGDSESTSSMAFEVPVLRNTAGQVTGFGPASATVLLRAHLDGGLDRVPGTAGTWLARLGGGLNTLYQETASGTNSTYSLSGSEVYGGSTFVPSHLPNGDRLLVSNYTPTGVGSIQEVAISSITADLATFAAPTVFASNVGTWIGGLHYIPSSWGVIADDILYANFEAGTLEVLDIDSLTGNPVGGVAALPSIFATCIGSSSVDGPGPWGIDFDPITGDLFVGVFGYDGPATNSIVHIEMFRYPELCFGDGGNQMGCTSCPCGNNTIPGSLGGCINSTGNGTRLTAAGSPSVSLPSGSLSDLAFGAEGAPPLAFCILNAGDALAPGNMANPCFGMGSGTQAAAFDGLRCAISNTRRHGGRSADANGEVGVTNNPWGGAGGPPVGLAQSGPGYVAGQTRYFQIVHRDDPLEICMRGLNTSQAVEVVFIP